MPDSVTRIDQHPFSSTDKLLLDANVWLFIYSPQYRPSDQPGKTYSSAYKQILKAHSQVFIDGIVLSEFVNVLARLAFNSMGATDRPSDFKAFRKSSSFRPVAESIADSCRRIFKDSNRIESGFASLDVEALIDCYEAGRCDVNDLILTELCKSEELTFVTDDADFRESGLTILTANARLLR